MSALFTYNSSISKIFSFAVYENGKAGEVESMQHASKVLFKAFQYRQLMLKMVAKTSSSSKTATIATKTTPTSTKTSSSTTKTNTKITTGKSITSKSTQSGTTSSKSTTTKTITPQHLLKQAQTQLEQLEDSLQQLAQLMV